MEPREIHVRPLGICYRLYHFIMRTLASQALKTVTLGRPAHYEPTKVPVLDADQVRPPIKDHSGDSVSSSTERVQEKNESRLNCDEIPEGPTSLPDQSKAPKKMVSINENVEEIQPIKKKKKKNRSFRKSNSLDREEEEGREEPKPLKSILKMGSNMQRDQSNSEY